MDKKELSFYKNGASLGQAFRSIPAGKWYIASLSSLRSKSKCLFMLMYRFILSGQHPRYPAVGWRAGMQTLVSTGQSF
jgi:hypothetical protein